MLNISAAHTDHATAWQQYVHAHDGEVEEQADKIRQADSENRSHDYRFDHPGRVYFRGVDYTIVQQPRSQLARDTDGEPVSPGTLLSEDQMSTAELERAAQND